MAEAQGSTGSGNISKQDLQRLQTSDVSQRKKFAQQLAGAYNNESTPDMYRRMAEDIFRVLAEDVAEEVRRTFSEMIKYSNNIPIDIIEKITQDVESVAVPVLQCCEALTEDNIIHIISSSDNNITKLGAIASRHDVTERVSDALIETEIEAVVSTLLSNDRASISEQGYTRIVHTFNESSQVIQNILNRTNIPVSAINNITTNVSNHILSMVTTEHPEAKAAIKKIAKQATDVVNMRAVGGLESNALDYTTFMERMATLGVAEQIIPIAALSLGKVNLFESYVAHTLQVPVVNVRALMSDETNKGLRAIYRKMNLPERLFEATSLLVDVLRDIEQSSGHTNISTVNIQMTNRIVEELNMRAEELHIDQDNIDYVCGVIRHSQRLFDHI